MHLEIARVPDDELTEIHDQLSKVLIDVRDAVEDWQRMHDQVDKVIEDLEQNPPPLQAEEIEQGKALLRWLGDNHFTFLGYREYVLEARADEETLVAVPGTGFGILRADPHAARVLPEAVASRARDKELLVLAKANSRATVHRPVFLDYVGVKKFGPDGEVTGERRFLGLFSSAAYTESVRRIPVLREKAARVIDTVGLDPNSHAGKALMDVLETYPRDELFQTPVADLVPIASQVMYTRERRQLQAVHPPRHLRPLPLVPRLPAAGPLQHHRPRAHRHDPQAAARRGAHRVHRPRRGVLRRTAALRGPAGRGRADRGARHPRPRAPLRRGRALLEGRLHQRRHHDVRRGAGQPARPALLQLLPRGLQGGLPAPDRSGRPRPPRGHPGGGGAGTLALRGRRRGAGGGAVEGLPDRAATVPLRGPADPVHHGRRGRRRAALPARGAGAGVLHLRLRAALPARDARPCAGAVPGHRRCRVERAQRERRLQRPGAGSGTHLAPGHGAARLRQVHAAGRHALRAGLHRGRAAQQRGDHALPRAAVRGAVRPRPTRPRRRRHRRRQRGPAGQVRRPGGAHRARPRRGLEPRRRPDPAVLPDRHPGDAAHQLLRHRLRRPARSTGSR